jgi:hypothetical protein
MWNPVSSCEFLQIIIFVSLAVFQAFLEQIARFSRLQNEEQNGGHRTGTLPRRENFGETKERKSNGVLHKMVRLRQH